jgi:uncharacterized protein
VNKPQIELPKDKIAEFCHRNHIRRLAVFGSALREDFRPDSACQALETIVAGE